VSLRVYPLKRVGQFTPGSRTTLRTRPPLITSDREYTPARSADKHLPDTHCRIIESFNGRLRDECLNQHWFLSRDEARAVTQAWREDYHHVRPHGALGNQPRMANNPAGIKAGAASVFSC
jgi:transposase InsO family protein